MYPLAQQVKAIATPSSTRTIAMSTFALSFNIHYDDTYSDRYGSLMAEVRKCSKIWAETTSFCLVQTAESLTAFESRLYLSKFAPSKDRMLVIDVSFDSAIARGKIDYPSTLGSMLPGIAIK
jgi:hypothetical protein